MYTRRRKNQGVGSVEVIIGVSIAALVLVFASNALVLFIHTGRDIAERTQALYLAEEGLEMVRHLRDTKWSHIGMLADGTTYYLDVTPSQIATSTAPEVIGQFTRSFTVESVERDGNDDIVTSGTTDPNVKEVTATVSWDGESVSLTTLIADLRNP